MRNIIVFGLAAVCAVLIAGNTLANEKEGGGGGGGYDNGGGKETQKHCVIVKNKEHYGYGKTYCVWIKEKPKKGGYGGYGYQQPPSHNYGKLHKQMLYVEPYSHKKSPKYKKGYYEVWLFDPYSFKHYGYNDYIPHDTLVGYKLHGIDVHIDRYDVKVHCKDGKMGYGH